MEHKIGDFFYCGKRGIGRLKEIGGMNFRGNGDDQLVIYIGNVVETWPPEKVKEMGWLNITSDEALLETLGEILTDSPKDLPREWSERYKLCHDVVESCDLLAMAAVYRDLMWMKSFTRNMSFGERQLINYLSQFFDGWGQCERCGALEHSEVGGERYEGAGWMCYTCDENFY